MSGTMLTGTSGVSRGWNSLIAISEEAFLTGGVETVGTFSSKQSLRPGPRLVAVQNFGRLDALGSVRVSHSSDRVAAYSRYGRDEIISNIATMEDLRLGGRSPYSSGAFNMRQSQ